MPNGECTLGATHGAEIIALKETTKSLHDVDEDQWRAINVLRNRLPAWATAVISLLTFLCGILGTLATLKGAP